MTDPKTNVNGEQNLRILRGGSWSYSPAVCRAALRSTQGPLMPMTVLLDEWHVTFRIPASLPDAEVRAVRRVLTGKAFTTAVRRAVLAVVRKRPVLKPVRVMISR